MEMMSENKDTNTKRFVAEYYADGRERMSFFTANSGQEIIDYLKRKYGESVEIIQIIEQNKR